MLEALHPGRIDLGLGRAPGTDTFTAFAMRRSREAMMADDYPEQLAEFIAYDDESFPADHPFAAIRRAGRRRMPPIWLLGSSDFSARLAARGGTGIRLRRAHQLRRRRSPALRDLSRVVLPSTRYPEPRSILTVSVTVGETAEQAREFALINDLLRLRLRTGQLGRYPTLAEAKAYPFTPAERAVIAAMPMRSLAGTATEVRDQIDDLAERSQADEVMITTFLAELADRQRTIVDLAAAFALPAPQEITPAF